MITELFMLSIVVLILYLPILCVEQEIKKNCSVTKWMSPNDVVPSMIITRVINAQNSNTSNISQGNKKGKKQNDDKNQREKIQKKIEEYEKQFLGQVRVGYSSDSNEHFLANCSLELYKEYKRLLKISEVDKEQLIKLISVSRMTLQEEEEGFSLVNDKAYDWLKDHEPEVFSIILSGLFIPCLMSLIDAGSYAGMINLWSTNSMYRLMIYLIVIYLFPIRQYWISKAKRSFYNVSRAKAYYKKIRLMIDLFEKAYTDLSEGNLELSKRD